MDNDLAHSISDEMGKGPEYQGPFMLDGEWYHMHTRNIATITIPERKKPTLKEQQAKFNQFTRSLKRHGRTSNTRRSDGA